MPRACLILIVTILIHCVAVPRRPTGGAGKNGMMKIEIGIPQVGRQGMPESGCGFVSEDIGRELVMTKDCPEIERGKAKG